jgi:hypothetical protein
MLVTIACIVISITAFSVMKKLMKNRRKKNPPNQTMATLTPGSYIDRKKSDQYFQSRYSPAFGEFYLEPYSHEFI